jgi:hypothetical protein
VLALHRIEAFVEELTNGELEDRVYFRPSFLCNTGVNYSGLKERLAAPVQLRLAEQRSRKK